MYRVKEEGREMAGTAYVLVYFPIHEVLYMCRDTYISIALPNLSGREGVREAAHEKRGTVDVGSSVGEDRGGVLGCVGWL